MEPPLLAMSREKCRTTLRRMELESYASVISTLRAQGILTERKRKLLDEVRQIFRVSEDRHRAEARRVYADETLCTIAEILFGPNTQIEWSKEGRRTVPLIPRATPHSALAILASAAAIYSKIDQPIENAMASRNIQGIMPDATVKPIITPIVTEDPNKPIFDGDSIWNRIMVKNEHVDVLMPKCRVYVPKLDRSVQTDAQLSGNRRRRSPANNKRVPTKRKRTPVIGRSAKVTIDNKRNIKPVANQPTTENELATNTNGQHTDSVDNKKTKTLGKEIIKHMKKEKNQIKTKRPAKLPATPSTSSGGPMKINNQRTSSNTSLSQQRDSLISTFNPRTADSSVGKTTILQKYLTSGRDILVPSESPMNRSKLSDMVVYKTNMIRTPQEQINYEKVPSNDICPTKINLLPAAAKSSPVGVNLTHGLQMRPTPSKGTVKLFPTTGGRVIIQTNENKNHLPVNLKPSKPYLFDDTARSATNAIQLSEVVVLNVVQENEDSQSCKDETISSDASTTIISEETPIDFIGVESIKTETKEMNGIKEEHDMSSEPIIYIDQNVEITDEVTGHNNANANGDEVTAAVIKFESVHIDEDGVTNVIKPIDGDDINVVVMQLDESVDNTDDIIEMIVPENESSNDETSELIETVIEELDPNQMNSNGHTNDLNVDTVKKSSENDVLLQLNGHHIDIIEAPSVKIIKPLNTSSPLLAESNGIID